MPLAIMFSAMAALFLAAIMSHWQETQCYTQGMTLSYRRMLPYMPLVSYAAGICPFYRKKQDLYLYCLFPGRILKFWSADKCMAYTIC